MDTSIRMKSQSSTEFMIFIGIAIIILMSYVAIAHHYLNLTYKQRDIISGQDLAKKIKNEINLASRVEDGYTRTFTLPQKIGNKDYRGYLQRREVVIIIDDLDYVELLATNVDENQINIIPGGTIRIEKNGGVTITILQ